MKYLKCIYFTACFFLFINNLIGQGWERIIPDIKQQTISVVQTPDNGFLLTGGSPNSGEGLIIMKLDQSGQVEWKDIYPDSIYLYGAAIIELSDGNYGVKGVAAHEPNGFTAFVMKIDIYGSILWSNEHYLLPFSAIAATADGGMIVSGRNGYLQGYNHKIQKILSDGKLGWQKQYNLNSCDDAFARVAVAIDGGFIFTGGSCNNPDSLNLPILTKTDSLGNIEWETFPDAISPITFGRGHDVIALEDGFVILGQGVLSPPYSSGGGVLLWKTDLEGNTIWYQQHEGSVGFSVVKKPDDGFAFVSLEGGGCLLTFTYPNGSKKERIRFGNDFIFGHIFSDHFNIINTNDKGFLFYHNIYTYSDVFFVKTDSLGQTFTNAIKGNATIDDPLNCETDSTEIPFFNSVIKVEGEDYEFYGETDSLGNYLIETDTGNYIVNILPINPYWQPCEDSIPVYFPNFFDTVQVDFPMEAVVDCPFLEVDITTPFLRRCFENTYYVNYCNTGTISADTAYLEITLDTFLNFISSSIPLTSQNGNVLIFELDTIEVGECGEFTFVVEVDCDADLGQTHCVEAHIYPDSICVPTPFWSGGSVEVDGVCENDTVYFSIKNKGNSTLSPGLEYIVIEDDVILYQQPIDELLPGQVQAFALESGGATFRLEADQEPNHPGNSNPTFIIEGCGPGFSPGFVNLFPMDDADPFIDIDCRENVGSYDPNDKQAFPVGFDEEHFIEQNTDIEYLIRFQNTGTDTAFRVVIRDTLSPFLDVTSVRPGVSSHPYEFDISGPGILKFTFDNILLPDSSINEPASNGFVKYKISQKENVPLGSVINNSAAIYFDFNAPIITNTTYHTIGEDFIPFNISEINYLDENISVNAFPNPFNKKATIELNGINKFRKKTFLLFNSTGQLMQEINFEKNRLEIDGSELNNGVYYFKIKNEEGLLVTGKVVVIN